MITKSTLKTYNKSNSADSSVHHLYTLQRGDTTAQIHNFCFSNDSRYLAAVTKRGTTHVFPINPYGGPATVRTHCSARVTNERSLFQISAGLRGHQRDTGFLFLYHFMHMVFSFRMVPILSMI